LSLEGANGTVDPSNISLNSAETKNVTLRVFLSDENIGKKDFRMVMKAEQFEEAEPFSLSVADCYNLAVDFGEALKQIDINAEEEKALTVLLKNLGSKTIEAQAGVSGPEWVYFQPSKRIIEPGRQEGIFLYISPPFDAREGSYNASMSISARDFNEEKKLSLKVYGGLYSLVGEARLAASSTLASLVEVAEKIVELKVVLKNDGNALLRLNNVNAVGYNSAVSFREAVLEPEQSTDFKLTLYLAKDFNKQQFAVPLRIATDRGEITRSIAVDLSKPVQAVGLFALGNAKDALIIVLALIVVVLITLIAVRAGEKEEKETTGISETAKEVEEEPARKLEQTGKRKKAARKRKK